MTPGMTEPEYRAIPALSCSSLKDLAVSPLRFWHKHLRHDREPEEPTEAMIVGSALHCAVLEPESFLDRYACRLVAEDYPGCLTTADTLKEHIRLAGGTPKGTTKAGWTAQVRSFDPGVPILDELERQHAIQTAGKTVLKRDDWDRVYGAAKALRDEPNVAELLSTGLAEQIFLVKDPETGVALKARMDWVRDDLTLDLKTFTQKRGKSIDKSITDAIWYEGYFRQAFFYSLIRGWPKTWNGDFVIAFVESEEPFEVRIRSLRPKVGSEVSLYWERARIEVRDMIRLYAECCEHFGDRPWRYAQEVSPLMDEEMKAMIWS